MIFERGTIFVDEDGIEHYPLFASAFLFPEAGSETYGGHDDGTADDPIVGGSGTNEGFRRRLDIVSWRTGWR